MSKVAFGVSVPFVRSLEELFGYFRLPFSPGPTL